MGKEKTAGSRAWEKEKAARPGCSTIGEIRCIGDGEDEEENNRLELCHQRDSISSKS